MSRAFPSPYYSNDSTWDKDFCSHGFRHGKCDECDREDDYEYSRGGLDKCLNCGKYKYGDQLSEDQTCIIPCRNPNEY